MVAVQGAWHEPDSHVTTKGKRYGRQNDRKNVRSSNMGLVLLQGPDAQHINNATSPEKQDLISHRLFQDHSGKQCPSSCPWQQLEYCAFQVLQVWFIGLYFISTWSKPCYRSIYSAWTSRLWPLVCFPMPMFRHYADTLTVITNVEVGNSIWLGWMQNWYLS